MDNSSPCSSFKRRRVLRAWTEEEDELLISHIEAHGEGNWNDIPKAARILRTGKSCRSRWYRYLHPSINFGGFTEEEEEMIINLHGTIGNRWSVIAKCLPGRTNGDIRKHWRSQYMRRKLISRGIDPDTHGPNNNQAAAETSHAAALYNAPLMSKRFRRENQTTPAGETSSELNLELTIRPLNRELRT